MMLKRPFKVLNLFIVNVTCSTNTE